MKDGRLSHEQISKEVGLSRPAVHDRIRRLESAGIIQGYTARVDWESLGLPLAAFVFVRTTGSCHPIAQRIFELSCESSLIQQCDCIAGDWCLLVQVRAASTKSLQELLDAILETPGVQNTMTTVSLTMVVPEPASAALVARSTQ